MNTKLKMKKAELLDYLKAMKATKAFKKKKGRGSYTRKHKHKKNIEE